MLLYLLFGDHLSLLSWVFYWLIDDWGKYFKYKILRGRSHHASIASRVKWHCPEASTDGPKWWSVWLIRWRVCGGAVCHLNESQITEHHPPLLPSLIYLPHVGLLAETSSRHHLSRSHDAGKAVSSVTVETEFRQVGNIMSQAAREMFWFLQFA